MKHTRICLSLMLGIACSTVTIATLIGTALILAIHYNVRFSSTTTARNANTLLEREITYEEYIKIVERSLRSTEIKVDNMIKCHKGYLGEYESFKTIVGAYEKVKKTKDKTLSRINGGEHPVYHQDVSTAFSNGSSIVDETKIDGQEPLLLQELKESIKDYVEQVKFSIKSIMLITYYPYKPPTHLVYPSLMTSMKGKITVEKCIRAIDGHNKTEEFYIDDLIGSHAGCYGMNKGFHRAVEIYMEAKEVNDNTITLINDGYESLVSHGDVLEGLKLKLSSLDTIDAEHTGMVKWFISSYIGEIRSSINLIMQILRSF